MILELLPQSRSRDVFHVQINSQTGDPQCVDTNGNKIIIYGACIQELVPVVGSRMSFYFATGNNTRLIKYSDLLPNVNRQTGDKWLRLVSTTDCFKTCVLVAQLRWIEGLNPNWYRLFREKLTFHGHKDFGGGTWRECLRLLLDEYA